jgi:fatty-acyl-CoA synthase
MSQFATRGGVPQCTLQNYDDDFAGRHTLHGVIAHWARRKPDAVVIFNADTRQETTWQRLDQVATAFALKLLDMGFRKGDFLATSLPFLTEHVFLEYACFKIGVIHAPLDLRLKAQEVIRSLSLIHAKGYAFLGQTPVADFRELGKAVQANCPFVEHFIQFSGSGEEVIPGAWSAQDLAAKAQDLASAALQAGPAAGPLAEFLRATQDVSETDGAQVIFTTGSTGYPKPALLSHRNITCQNMCLGAGLGMGEETRMLVNLPPSHVGGQAEQFMTPLFYGGQVVLLHVFDPARSLQAVQDYKINVIGQIPAMFNLEWRLPNYADYDFSSLQTVLYGGQQVPRPFLEHMLRMAPRAGTGLGLTESGGFCTYTSLDGTVDDILAGVGYDMPVYPMTIRAPQGPDGMAGAVLPDGEIGHICFQGPQTFLGYVGDLEATARAITRDGVLYTGDMGCKDDRGLHFAGRARWIIKPKGYQVFPGQVEDYLCELRDKVAAAAVVGIEHDIFSEGIVAFVEARQGADLTMSDLQRHAEGIASYMRPLHYVILPPGGLPLNRVAKTDYVHLLDLAREEVVRLRAAGGWDRA